MIRIKDNLKFCVQDFVFAWQTKLGKNISLQMTEL